jgi:hypothetical protein
LAVSDQQISKVSNPVLREFLEQLEALRLDARELVAGLTREQFNWRPGSRRWSVGQCIEHIVLTGRLYPEPIRRMIAESRQRKLRGERGYREGVIARWIVSGMEPPPKLRVRGPRRVEPGRELDPVQVMASFEAIHDDFAELMVEADGTSLLHSRMASPFMPVLRLTLRQTFAINLAHARRHLWQAWLVRRATRFPNGVSG